MKHWSSYDQPSQVPQPLLGKYTIQIMVNQAGQVMVNQAGHVMVNQAGQVMANQDGR